ncbi:hypothetical protein GCM10023168_21570 [Fodinibacter luteus]|uniref:WD40 repeat protein n=1 Tax=Fodinibacter luteus TaxID=552064 RepID=A0ABP8KH79_9MICO
MLEQPVATGRVRRRAATIAGLTAAAVLALAGLSFAWAGHNDQALEPVPANPSTSASIGSGIASPMQRWVDALPAGAPPATPYWHDGTLYVNGERIPAPYGRVDIEAAGDTVLVGGYQGDTKDVGPLMWGLVRGDRLEPLPVPAGTYDVWLSVDGRIAYWMARQDNGTTRFFTWDTETNTALASRTVPGNNAELRGVDAAGNAYWQPDYITSDLYSRWDVRADTITATDLTYEPWDPPEWVDGFVPWMPSEDPYRSPDGTKRAFTGSAPSDSPSDCCINQLRVRPVAPDDQLDPKDVSTLSLSDAVPYPLFDLNEPEHWVWWESNESVLIAVDGDLRSYLVRCPATGGTCQRVLDLGPWTDANHQQDSQHDPYWLSGGWAFGRAPVSR